MSGRIPVDCLVSREPTHLQLLLKTIQIYRVPPCYFTQVLFQPQLLYSVSIFVRACVFFGLLVFDLYFWSIKLRNQSFRLIPDLLLLLDSLVRYPSCGLQVEKILLWISYFFIKDSLRVHVHRMGERASCLLSCLRRLRSLLFVFWRVCFSLITMVYWWTFICASNFSFLLCLFLSTSNENWLTVNMI